MTAYKEDQGRLARMFAFWAIAFMVLFGCTWLHGMLVQYDSLRNRLADIRIPVVAVDLNIAFLVSFVLFAGCILVLAWWVRRPKIADLLIETEAELRKVTWPKSQEVVNSSMVVIVFVIILLGFLAGTDAVLSRVFNYIIFGAG